MPRPTRIQYENAFYHVMNRGRARERIFGGSAYYQAFLKTLEEAHQRFDARIHAYCLMGNHYHLLVETPRANLDRIMRHINGVYTQRHNRLKRTDGPLFRGRYKAILVDNDAYLLQAGRYIHRNPAEVKGAVSGVLKTHHWSSYPAYVNEAKAPNWLTREQTYQMLGQKHRYAGYRAFVEAGNDEAIQQFYSKGNMGTILGDTEFRRAIAEDRDEVRISGDLSRALSERPGAGSIVQTVAKVWGVDEKTIVLRQSGRQVENLPRKMAIYCCQQIGDMSMTDIAGYFALSHPGSVSSGVADIKKRLAAGELDKQYRRIARYLDVIK